MRINKINTNTAAFGSSEQKQGFLDQIHARTKNSADMTDTIVVPRTIFKGYLGIMSGTTLLTLGGLLNKYSKLSKTLSFAGALTSMYGTWAFVRPFILKDSNGVEKTK